MKYYMGALLGVAVFVSASSAMADDAAKLQALERAVSAPAEQVTVTKKARTRAIVFDDKPEASAAPAANSAGANCSSVPPDAKLTVVDFTIQFKLGSAEIASESEKVLREISRILSLSDKCVIVEGHTDSIGNADRNNALSRERADSVVNFISQKANLDKSRLIPVGKGSSEPLQNLNPRNPQNRRVVFKVVG
ncbi:MAG: OmpA family protein [Gallionella sp.]|nr:OmpA family protein [Gallionella sp.]